jgi:hypothetical protein
VVQKIQGLSNNRWKTSHVQGDSFFDYRGVVHHEFVPQGQTVNKEFYLEVVRRLRNR